MKRHNDLTARAVRVSLVPSQPKEAPLMNPQTVFTVIAYRYGNREAHSYPVGVYPTAVDALKAAEIEEDYRGGKYECEVMEFTLGIGQEGDHDKETAKTIKPLRERAPFDLEPAEKQDRDERGRFKAKCAPPPEPVWNYPQMPNTQEVGWYATLYCWDGSEGIFAGGNRWLGDRWEKNLPVYAWAGPFSTMVKADEWAIAHNPEDM
jgi:hypothetical protein